MDKILKLLQNPKPSGKGYTAQCPAHDDKHNSLSISQSDDKILLHCHAGCTAENIVSKLNLQMKDLFLNGKAKKLEIQNTDTALNIKYYKEIPAKYYGGYSLVQKYIYTNESGNIKFAVARYENTTGKKFLPYTLTDKGWTAKCEEKYLYKLPELLQAKTSNNTIFICEGEKDVDTMYERGFAATTNPFGASSWDSSFNKYFQDCNVVILPDNDDAGKAHSVHIAKQIYNYAKSIKIVNLPLNKPKEDVSDYFNIYKASTEDLNELVNQTPYYQLSPEIIEKDIKLPFCFWYEHKSSKKADPELKIDIDALIEFLIDEGICIMKNDEEGLNRVLIQIKNNIVNRIDEGLIRNKLTNDYLNILPEFISENFTKSDLRRLLRKGINNYIEKNKLDSLPLKKIKWLEDTKDTAYFFFANGFVEVSKNGSILKPYSLMSGCIWKSQIINHDIQLTNKEYSDSLSFVKFTKNICTSPITKTLDEARYLSLNCSIGYLLHRHIDISNIFSIIFTENNLSNEPEGRTGKTLLIKQAIGKMRNVTLLDGRSTNFQTNEFAFQQCEMDTQIILIDDCKANLDFEWFFSKITGETEINKKKKQSFIINAKYCFTTNYGVKGNSGSNLARRFDMELFTYYSKDFSPKDEFGEAFFADWNNDQWQQFYNFMLYCSAEYFKNNCSIPKYNSETINERKLLSETNEDFISFADNLPRNEFLSAVDTYEKYLEFSGENPKMFSKPILARWIKSYCINRNIEYISKVVKENNKSIRKHYLKQEDNLQLE